MTELEKIIGKKLTMKVSTEVEVEITVENEQSVVYQMVYYVVGNGKKGICVEDTPVRTKLEVAHDDISGVDDYSFKDKLVGERYFLFQFEEWKTNEQLT